MGFVALNLLFFIWICDLYFSLKYGNGGALRSPQTILGNILQKSQSTQGRLAHHMENQIKIFK